MKTWLTCKELAELEGVHHVTIAVRVRDGKYKQIKRVRGHGGGMRGQMWLVSVYDRAIPTRVREKYFLRKMIKEILRAEIKNIYERLKKRKFMELSVREFFKALSEDLFL